jgi:hypothetical protein
MKLTKEKLKQIIKEELENKLNENIVVDGVYQITGENIIEIFQTLRDMEWNASDKSREQQQKSIKFIKTLLKDVHRLSDDFLAIPPKKGDQQ